GPGLIHHGGAACLGPGFGVRDRLCVAAQENEANQNTKQMLHGLNSSTVRRRGTRGYSIDPQLASVSWPRAPACEADACRMPLPRHTGKNQRGQEQLPHGSETTTGHVDARLQL